MNNKCECGKDYDLEHHRMAEQGNRETMIGKQGSAIVRTVNLHALVFHLSDSTAASEVDRVSCQR